VLVLYQAEWCPYSHRVRMVLTELGLEWLARPQPVERADRDAMERETGTRSIPTLADGDEIVSGAGEIVDHLRRRYGEPGDAGRHRAMMRKEWPHWVELHGGTPDAAKL